MSGLRIGDVVRLTCGRPGITMTVTFIDPHSDNVQCEWHDFRGKPQCEEYPREALQVERESA